MVGQVQKLNRNKAIEHYKASGLDLTPILHKVDISENQKPGKTVFTYRSTVAIVCFREKNAFIIVNNYFDLWISNSQYEIIFSRKA
jgi:hypothetical protein